MTQKGMKGREIDFIPDRLIEDPIVFNGMTDREIIMIAIGGIAFWVPVCVIILSFFKYALFGIGLGLGLTIVSLGVIGKKLSILKRKMPDGLHILFLKKELQERTSMNFGYINESEYWDICRTYPVIKEQVVSDE